MTGSDALFAGSVPEIYERYLVPLIFESYAADLADRLVAIEDRDVLELAAGTGALTRAIANAHPLAHIVATDLNQPMLDQAMARQPAGNRVTWRQADAQALPFPDGTFDAVFCQFGVMFFPDKIAAYRDVLRVLKPDGQFLFNVWDRISENEFASVITDSLATIFPECPPDFLARTPHSYHNVQRVRGELKQAGFSGISSVTVECKSRAACAKDGAIAFCQGTPLRNDIVARDASRLDEATEVAAEALAHRFGRGSIEGRIRAHVLMATRESKF